MPRLYEWSLPPASPFELAQLDYYKGQCRSKFLRSATAGLSELLTCRPAGRFRGRAGFSHHTWSAAEITQKNEHKKKRKERQQAFNLCTRKDLKVPNPTKAQAAQLSGRANRRAVAVIDGHLACSVHLSICRIHKKRCWGNYVCRDILKAGAGAPRNGWQL